ncbi:MAG: hypothetical protein IKD06_03950 [Clostridia bacterium]|nr:hypothetical protein [Clostridia bacterium]
MKIKFLGTAAAEGIPALFCNCRVCRNALEKRGKEVKTRSQSIIDDKILIDFPADTYMHMLYNGLDLKTIHTCVFTHCHSDHLYERDFWCRNKGIGNEIEDVPLNVYVTHAGYEQCRKFVERNVFDGRVLLNEIHPFVPFEAEGYRFIPLKADHDPAADPVFYIIEHGDKTLLYANDTGIFPAETWEYLAGYGRRFDMVSYDCTGMILENCRQSHMSLSSNAEVHERLCQMGLCDENTVAYVNHFSHNSRATHEELVEAADKYGFRVSYDGLEVEF